MNTKKALDYIKKFNNKNIAYLYIIYNVNQTSILFKIAINIQQRFKYVQNQPQKHTNKIAKLNIKYLCYKIQVKTEIS